MYYKIYNSYPGKKRAQKISVPQMTRKCSALFQLCVPHKHVVYACYFSQNQAAEDGHFLTMIDISSVPFQYFLILK